MATVSKSSPLWVDPCPFLDADPEPFFGNTQVCKPPFVMCWVAGMENWNALLAYAKTDVPIVLDRWLQTLAPHTPNFAAR